MTAFKALLIKDLQINKKALAITIWIVLGLYVVLIGSFIYASRQNLGGVMLGGIPMDMFSNGDLTSVLSFAVQVALMFGFLGFMFGIQMISISAFLLNSDVAHKCELFHRSQPVNVWQITASRFIAGIGGVIGLTLLAGLLQFVLGNLLLFLSAGMQVNWWMSLNGVLLSWAHLSVSMLVLGSFGFLLSSIFRVNAFGKGALILGAVEIAVIIMNYFMHLGIPSPFKSLSSLAISNLRDFTRVFPTLQYGIQFGAKSAANAGFEAFQLPSGFLSTLWATLFTWGVALKLAVTGLLYVLATCIYQRREVQF